ncbi:hypothetical protein PENTCL1PPCAC_19510, partial [Pristionchus entomophagus]
GRRMRSRSRIRKEKEPVKSILRSIAGYQSAYLSAGKKFPTTDKTVVHDAFKSMTIQCVAALSEKDWLPKDEDKRRRFHLDPAVFRRLHQHGHAHRGPYRHRLHWH